MYYEIGVVRQGIDFFCIYCTCDDLPIGQFVSINFNHREVVGIVFNKQLSCSYTGHVKNITTTLPYILRNTCLNFVKFISSYNLIPVGSALKLICPFTLKTLSRTSKRCNGICNVVDNDKIALNNAQQKAADAIVLNKFKTYLLHGVTGSGKTEVFLEIVKKLNNKQVLILVPEIALSNTMARSIAQRSNREVFIWHNSVTTANKLNIWQRAISGEPIVVVGARSALFIPFADLKLIVVDEEHDPTFKQNEHQIYNARDMAVYLASLTDIPIILSSATPSIESYKNAMENKYHYLPLTSRYHEHAVIPEVKIHNMCSLKRTAIFSIPTIEKIKYYLENNQQVLIFVNRRGYSTKRLCTNCGWKATCPACDTWLCYHAVGAKLSCHHCGYTCSNIKRCKRCNNDYLVNYGIGIEKVYAECQKLFPKYRTMMYSSDNMDTPAKIDRMISDITAHKVDIIIGTQILAKGHNFNAINLVVIANLDYMLYSDDFRALENTYQLLSQVAGRAGRTGKAHAEVIIQTYNPNESMLSMIKTQDEFYTNELRNRKLTDMPPYSHIVGIEISAFEELTALNYANELIKHFRNLNNITVSEILIPTLHKLNYKYRYRILLISKHRLQTDVQTVLKKVKLPHKIKIKVDVDPYMFD